MGLIIFKITVLESTTFQLLNIQISIYKKKKQNYSAFREQLYLKNVLFIFFFFIDDLTIDYQFTFNLSKKDDLRFTQINFQNSPSKSDVDADFSITCSVIAKMNITVKPGTYLKQ